ncbi:MAG: hypothetical protein ACLVGG_02660 [Bacteroides nordii]
MMKNKYIYIVLLFVVFVLLLRMVISSEGQTVPVRPSKVPMDAGWYGGADGGVWIKLSDTSVDGTFYVEIYRDYTGDLWQKGIFYVDSLYLNKSISIRELQNTILGYFGDNKIYVKGRKNIYDQEVGTPALYMIGTGRDSLNSPPPKRHKDIPDDTYWYGDTINGFWMSVKGTKKENVFYVEVYFRESGQLRDKNFYELDSFCAERNYTVDEIRKHIYDYAGDVIYMV